ncbi:uncharacterized protein LOC110663445 isoform X2 [Hevea brasiliensis]|uniref:uncharacterized protein LOC110663445 isoform X2 n=1 Tax=Hevea brasiliensis TaxID=3981 RepID=UPI0025FE7922|nr:uncharacterized protein LOC110663445 isoform X2 [Hevea brasiliensis]
MHILMHFFLFNDSIRRMMSGDNFTEGVSKKRVVLGDLTNCPIEREFSSVSNDVRLKSGDGYGKRLVTEDEDSRCAKQVCLGVENLVKEKCKTKFGIDNSSEKGLFLMEDKQPSDSSPTDSDIDTSQENTVSIISHRPNENKETSLLLDGGVNVLKSVTLTQSVGEGGDASRDSSASTGSMPTNSSSCKKDSDDEGRLTSDVKQSNPEGHVGTGVDKDLGVGILASSKYGPVEWSRLPKSQGSKSYELDRCTALKGNGCANLSAGADLMKACSCSFCLKAAYIWSDLHYQDIKGRTAALKKSQKEASILVNKYARGKQTDIHSQGNSNKSSKLESDLTTQWRSLFHHMEDIFVHENNQLQANFVALKDLRENCKMDLERTTGMPSDN